MPSFVPCESVCRVPSQPCTRTVHQQSILHQACLKLSASQVKWCANAHDKKLGLSVTAAARPRNSFWGNLTAKVTAGDAGAITWAFDTRPNLSHSNLSHTRQ